MTIRSMTGYGQGELETSSGTYNINIKSVNNRYLDIQVRFPKPFAPLEIALKKMVSSRISRGSVTVYINWEHGEDDTKVSWNRSLVNQYFTMFSEIATEHSLPKPSFQELLTFSDFIEKESITYPEDELFKDVEAVLNMALDDIMTVKEKEAAYIIDDFKKTIHKIDDLITKVEKQAPLRLEKYTAELKRKISVLVSDSSADDRLALEIALMADKLDIAEECLRMRAHIEKFLDEINQGGAVGKKMGFILQEMNREANTISSKANDTTISHYSVELKECIEQIREQALNLE